MVDIQSVAAEIRRGKKEEEEDRRKKLQGKNIMPPLLHRAAIKNWSAFSRKNPCHLSSDVGFQRRWSGRIVREPAKPFGISDSFMNDGTEQMSNISTARQSTGHFVLTVRLKLVRVEHAI